VKDSHRQGELKEHEAAKWLHKDELENVDWLPADETVVKRLREGSIKDSE